MILPLSHSSKPSSGSQQVVSPFRQLYSQVPRLTAQNHHLETQLVISPFIIDIYTMVLPLSLCRFTHLKNIIWNSTGSLTFRIYNYIALSLFAHLKNHYQESQQVVSPFTLCNYIGLSLSIQLKTIIRKLNR